jgi:O-succinylbenzoic acid--CoA ligase
VSLSVLDAARDAPELAAIVAGPRSTSYAALARDVEPIVARFASSLEPRSRIAFVADPTESTVRFVHAILASGHTAVPMHARWTEAERERWIALVRPHAYVRDTAESPIALDVRAAPPGDGALAILSTSGTSGAPKPAVLSREAFLASAAAASARVALGPGDRWLLGLSVAHVGGLSIVTRSLLARSAIAIGDRGSFEPQPFVDVLERHRVTVASVVPAMLHAIAREGLPCPRSLREMLVGGAAASPELLDRARALGYPVRATYGLTEACSQVATDDDRGALRPLPGIEVAIRDDTIHVRGPVLFDGYLRDGALERPFDDGWFDTGDLGRIDGGRAAIARVRVRSARPRVRRDRVRGDRRPIERRGHRARDERPRLVQAPACDLLRRRDPRGRPRQARSSAGGGALPRPSTRLAEATLISAAGWR